MKKRILGRTGLEVSVIGFGGIPIQGISTDEAARVIHAALDRGVNFIDTARGYTDSEQKLGGALEGRREQVILASKAMSRDAEGMAAELETSLGLLGTDCIDLYQLHAVGSEVQLETVLGPGGAYEALASAREQGKVRFIGVTGHSRPVLARAVETGHFDTVQVPFNPLEPEALEDVIPAARARNVGVIGMKPVAGGALRDVPAGFRYALLEGVDVVIPGMDSVEQVDANAAAGEEFAPLTAAEKESIEEDRKVWKGAFCHRCGYCMPCPNGLDIPTLLLLQAYHERYDLTDWAQKRLAPLEKRYDDCEACGDCMERCPYALDIPALMEKGAEQLS